MLTFNLPVTDTAYDSLTAMQLQTFRHRCDVLLTAMVEWQPYASLAGEPGHLHICHPAIELNSPPKEADDQYLDLYEFAAFVERIGWDAPVELVALAVSNRKPSESELPARPSLLKPVNASVVPENSEKPVTHTNARGFGEIANTRLKIIAALLPLAYAEATAPGDLSALTRKLHKRAGLGINGKPALTRRTVLAHVDEAIRDHESIVASSILFHAAPPSRRDEAHMSKGWGDDIPEDDLDEGPETDGGWGAG